MPTKKEFSEILLDELLRLVGQGTYPDASRAQDLALKIKNNGGSPAIYYSKFNNGFIVLDENDPEQLRRSLALRNRSRRFRM